MINQIPGIDAVYLHECPPFAPPVMSVEVMQLRAALDYFMKLVDDAEKGVRELQLECEAAYKEIDRLNAVVAAWVAAYEQVNSDHGLDQAPRR